MERHSRQRNGDIPQTAYRHIRLSRIRPDAEIIRRDRAVFRHISRDITFRFVALQVPDAQVGHIELADRSRNDLNCLWIRHAHVAELVNGNRSNQVAADLRIVHHFRADHFRSDASEQSARNLVRIDDQRQEIVVRQALHDRGHAHVDANRRPEIDCRLASDRADLEDNAGAVVDVRAAGHRFRCQRQRALIVGVCRHNRAVLIYIMSCAVDRFHGHIRDRLRRPVDAQRPRSAVKPWLAVHRDAHFVVAVRDLVQVKVQSPEAVRPRNAELRHERNAPCISHILNVGNGQAANIDRGRELKVARIGDHKHLRRAFSAADRYLVRHFHHIVVVVGAARVEHFGCAPDRLRISTRHPHLFGQRNRHIRTVNPVRGKTQRHFLNGAGFARRPCRQRSQEQLFINGELMLEGSRLLGAHA